MPGDKERKGIPSGGSSMCAGTRLRNNVDRGQSLSMAEAGVPCSCWCGSVHECECAREDV